MTSSRRASTPTIQYTRTSDGKRIAYSAAGSGPALVRLPMLFSHVQIMETMGDPLLDGLRERFQVAIYDARGQGMSTRGLDTDHTIDHWQRDLEAVVDALGVGRVVLFGACHSGHVAVRFALSHPERVHALLLVSCCVRMRDWGPGSFWEHLPYENWDLFLTMLLPAERRSHPSAMRGMRSMVTQEEYRVFDAAVVNSSVAEELPRLEVPVLVVHPRNQSMLRPEQGVEFASLIPGARFLFIGGGEGQVLGDPLQLVEAIDDFLCDLPELRPPTRDPTDGARTPAMEPLSNREREVLRLITAGRSNREIAASLVISVRTVERHLTNIYGKTGVRGRAGAAAFALKNGLA